LSARNSAKAIVINNGKLLVNRCHSRFGEYFTLPGGGQRTGEMLTETVRRELLEETGCRTGTVTPLGYVEENRAHADYTQLSFYFIVDTPDETLAPRLTASEAAHGTEVMWLSPEEAWQRISQPVFGRPQGRFLQARDVAALQAYQAACRSPEE